MCIRDRDFYAQYKEVLGDLYDKYDFENLVKVDDNTAAMVSRQLGTYGLGTNVSRSLMVNRLYGKMMSERTDGKVANYTYLFSHSTPESISDLGTDRGWANQWAWHTSEMWYAFNSLREGVPEAVSYTHLLMAVPNPEQELQIRAIQGEFPDIVEFIGAQKDDLVKYVKGGYLQKLDNFSATHCVNEHFLEKLKILNGTYVLPLSVNYRGIFYNKRMLRCV